MTNARRSLLAALAAWSVACAGGGGPGRDTGSDAEPPVPDAPSYLPDLHAIRCEPTLASLREDVFPVACGFDSCHGSNNGAWGLLLLEPDVGEQLARPAASCSGWTRVVQGSPDESFLWRKVADDAPPCGERMPLFLERLPGSVLACFRGWIEGARDAGPDAAGKD